MINYGHKSIFAFGRFRNNGKYRLISRYFFVYFIADLSHLQVKYYVGRLKPSQVSKTTQKLFIKAQSYLNETTREIQALSIKKKNNRSTPSKKILFYFFL